MKPGGMGEAHPAASSPRPPDVIDQFGPGPFKPGERGVHVLDLEGHMVHSFPSGVEEPRDCGLRVRWFEEFEKILSNLEERDADVLIGNVFGSLYLSPCRRPPPSDRFVESMDGDAEMIELRPDRPPVRTRGTSGTPRTILSRAPRPRPE